MVVELTEVIVKLPGGALGAEELTCNEKKRVDCQQIFASGT